MMQDQEHIIKAICKKPNILFLQTIYINKVILKKSYEYPNPSYKNNY